MSTARKMNMASVKGIMNKRILVTEQDLGRSLYFTIQGNGAVVDVKNKAGELVESITEPGTVLRKTIFNVRANSAVAMAAQINKELLKAGVAAEKAGNLDEAHEHFNAYLNAVQISFGILHPSKLLLELADGAEIAGKAEKITTDNGSLITLKADSVRVMAPAIAATTTFSFEDDDDTDADDDTETPEETAARLKAEAKLAKAAGKKVGA